MSTDYPNKINPEVEYRTLDRYPGYRFGNDGTIWSNHSRWPSARNWRVLKPTLNTSKYFQVNIKINGKQKHHLLSRLICEAFHGPCPEGMVCRHFPERDPLNNLPSNLSWATETQNRADQMVHGTHVCGEKSPGSKLKEGDIRTIRQMLSEGKKHKWIAKQFFVSPKTIYSIEDRTRWKHVI